MPYKIISAIGKVIDSQAKWEKVDLEQYPVRRLYKRYSTIRASLENPYTKEKGSVLVDDYEAEIRDETKTFKVYLESIGDKALPLGNLKTTLSKKGLLYHEALSNRFKVYPVQKGKYPDGNLSDKYSYQDLFIMKEKVDPVDLYKHTLITVNGYVHATDANARGLWVTNGYETIRKRDKICIGVISFENLGELKQIPITESMISKFNQDVDLYQECCIDIGEDCSEKTIMLVIGGFLHVLDYDVFTRVSNSAIKIKLKNTPLMERIHLSMEDLNISDTLFDKRYGETNVNLKDLYGDEFIKQYLTLSYSFIVLLDNKEVFKEITYPQQRGIPNNYLTDKLPLLPMMTRLGKFEEYVYVHDVDKYVLETADCQYKPRVYNTSFPLVEDSYYNDACTPTNRRRIPVAYFFNLLSFL